MGVVQMKKICICALKKERKSILEYIQQSGLIEMQQIKGEPEGFSRMDTEPARASFERNAALAESALEILARYAPERKSVFSALEGKKNISAWRYADITDRREEIIGYAARIIQLQKDLAALDADTVKLNGQLSAITPWLSMDVPGMTRGTARTSFLYGSIGESLSQEELYKKIEQRGGFPEAADVRVLYSDKNQTCVVCFCMKEDAEAFEAALRDIGFARPSLIMRSVPEKSRRKWMLRLQEYNERREAIENEIRDMADTRESLQIIADYFRSRAEKYEVLGTLEQSEHTFFVTGYIPAGVADTFADSLKSRYTVLVKVSDIPKKEEGPVLLKNNAFARPVEGVVASFGLPKRGEIDPSSIMSFFYYFLFGMMLSDAAYGFLIFATCFILIKKFPRMKESLNQSLHMFMYCGISTLIWGVLFGGYFGDVVTVVARTFFHKEITIPAVWFAPLDDPMRLLLYSMAFGIIHMFTGLGIKAYMLLKERRILDCICDVGLWYCFLTGLILMLIPTDIFASIAQTKIVFPGWLSVLSKVLAIGGLLGILLMSGRRKKNPFLRLALGLYDIYNVTGWLSDVLSYSRLLALGLATGVIASVVNLMGTMAGDGPVGVILFIIIFLVGHALNLAINLLGAYVHTNRLQYIEFFGKFYEGGGRAFNPFKLNTKYADVKEE